MKQDVSQSRSGGAENITAAEQYLDEHGVNVSEALDNYRAAETDNVKALKAERKTLSDTAIADDGLNDLRTKMADMQSAMSKIKIDEQELRESMKDMASALPPTIDTADVIADAKDFTPNTDYANFHNDIIDRTKNL